MALVHTEKEAVFLVGGTGTGSGRGIALSGGCTKDFFDANLDADGNFDPDLICGFGRCGQRRCDRWNDR